VLKQQVAAVLIAGVLCARVATLLDARENPPKGSTKVGVDVATAVKSGVSKDVLALALGAVACASSSGLMAPRTLTLIDYSRPSIEPRLWVFDLQTGELLFRELVAHGKESGDNIATRFSDALNSRESSLGLFVAGETYVGDNGYSLRLDGLEAGFNGHARERGIVMHGAAYVDPQLGARQGRIGRSWGCPALPVEVARRVIDAVRGGGAIFAYSPEVHWLTGSRFLNGCAGSTMASR
jgi:L,D-transpeptidase catalytic domain